MSSTKGIQLLKVITEYIKKCNGYEKVLDKVKLVSGGHGQCQAEFTVSEEHLNGGGSLHGGFTATLVDAISTYALMTNETHGANGGVSVDIHISYLRSAREGDEIVVDAKTVKAGKTLAFLEVELREKSKDQLIAKGNHTKFIGGA